jgi:putative transcriptional regulator
MDLFSVGAIDETTMREFDESCLVKPAQIAPKQIKKIRQSQGVSQPVFARYLNTSESTVEKWESGAKKPSGMALKLLSIVQKHGLQILA